MYKIMKLVSGEMVICTFHGVKGGVAEFEFPYTINTIRRYTTNEQGSTVTFISYEAIPWFVNFENQTDQKHFLGLDLIMLIEDPSPRIVDVYEYWLGSDMDVIAEENGYVKEKSKTANNVVSLH